MEKEGDEGVDRTDIPGVDIKGVVLAALSIVEVTVDAVEEAKGDVDDALEAVDED